MEGVVVGGEFKIGKKIGGYFSKVFEGHNIHTLEKVAIKLEPLDKKYPQLPNEIEFYKYLKGGVGIPSVKASGEVGNYKFMVIELLGRNLEDLRRRSDKGHFTLKTVLMLADQMIDIFTYMHSKGVIHRDIKPEIFLMGEGSNEEKVYLINFGQATFYKDPTSNEHILYREDTGFVGTHHYASLYKHLGFEQSRRDDAESLCHVLMYLFKGSLPWQEMSLGSSDVDNNLTISNLKFQHTQPEVLRDEYPPAFGQCFRFARYVSFYCTPAYLSMKIAVRDLLKSQAYDIDHVYDWTTYPKDE